MTTPKPELPEGWVLTQFARTALDNPSETPISCTLFFQKPGTGDDNPGVTRYVPAAKLSALEERLKVADSLLFVFCP